MTAFSYAFRLLNISFQSINVIECPQLRQIFLMLREDLTDADIPHRTYIRKCVIETWEKYIATLKSEMEVSLFLPAMYYCMGFTILFI